MNHLFFTKHEMKHHLLLSSSFSQNHFAYISKTTQGCFHKSSSTSFDIMKFLLLLSFSFLPYISIGQ